MDKLVEICIGGLTALFDLPVYREVLLGCVLLAFVIILVNYLFKVGE